MHFRHNGFTLPELMISVLILMLISTTAVFSLRSAQYTEELQTAARVLSSDIRNAQARALAARNVLTCRITGNLQRVCEIENPSTVPCIEDCVPIPPSRFGVHLTAGRDRYDVFADVQNDDWRQRSIEEILLMRGLNPLGGTRVVIDRLTTELGALPAADIAIGRQSGEMRIEACGEPLPSCAPTEPKTLGIILRHSVSGKELRVDVNAVTGRVSLP
jgi:prepilin-type N-terminal cleavage/methylation domain-containing protein